MQHLCLTLEGRPTFIGFAEACQVLVRFFALYRIKPHAPPLVRVPVNSFEFQPCDRTPQAPRLMGYLRQSPRAFLEQTAQEKCGATI